MIHLYEVKPCADYKDKIQIAGMISKESFSLDAFELLMRKNHFKVFRLGDPIALICRRTDCLFMIDSEGNFTLSEADSELTVQKVIDQIKM